MTRAHAAAFTSSAPTFASGAAGRSVGQRSGHLGAAAKPAGKVNPDANWRDAMTEALNAHDICLEQLLCQLGVKSSETDARMLSDAYNKVWELAAARSNKACIGLTELGHPIVAMGAISHLILSARNLGDALAHLQRYSLLLSPTIHLELVHSDGHSRLRAEYLKGLHQVPLQRYDFLANVLLQSLAWVTGKAVRPEAIEYPFAAPADLRPWQDAFGCELRFEAREFCIVFDSADLQTPIPTANPGVAALCVAEAQQQMASHTGSVQRRVRQVLLEQLPKGDPKRDTIATLLCMSERTLQRRLLEESTSFNKLLDETRREQAERFLAKGSISATEMSFALGFADPSNFYRACKRWFGHSPSHLRAGGGEPSAAANAN